MMKYNNGYIPNLSEIEKAAETLRLVRKSRTGLFTCEFFPVNGTFHIIQFDRDSCYKHPVNCIVVSAMCGTPHEDEYSGASALEIQNEIKSYIERRL